MSLCISSSATNTAQFLTGNLTGSSSISSSLNNKSCSVTNLTSVSSSATQRFALSLNNNLNNINNSILNTRNNNIVQLSPSKTNQLAAKLNLLQQQQQPPTSSNGLNNFQLTQQLNLLNNQSKLQPANVPQQNQHQQQQASSLIAAASILSATNNGLNSLSFNSLYQPQSLTSHSSASSSSQTCNLNNTLFVGNLHASLQEIDLIQVFRPFGQIVECCKKWLHFGFVKFTTEEEACHAYVTLNGFRLKGRPMRLEFQNRTKKNKIKPNMPTGLHGTNSSVSDLLSMGNLANLNIGNANTFPNVGNNNLSLINNALLANLLQQQSENISDRQQFSNLLSAQLNTNLTLQSLNNALNQASSMKSQQNQHASGLFNPDQLIKFANSLDLIDKESSNFLAKINQSQQSQQQLSSLNFETTNFCDFKDLDLKLNEDLLKESNNQTHKSFFDQINLFSSAEQNSGNSQSSKSVDLNANDDIVLSLIKNTISPVESSTSSNQQTDSLSLSTDSGCRSNSFLNDDDSAICSISVQQTMTMSTANSNATITSSKKNISSQSQNEGNKKNKKMSNIVSVSEHLEFTCSNSSPIKSTDLSNKIQKNNQLGEEEELNEDDEDDQLNDDGDDDCSSDCDTSDDASEIPDTESLNDFDLLDDLTTPNVFDYIQEENEYDEQLVTEKNEVISIERVNQVIDKDGSIQRKKLNCGIYASVNQTLSLFIEPHDILKKMDLDEFDEYCLFPSTQNKQEQDIIINDGTLVTKNETNFTPSNLDSVLVIKNHFYLI